MAATYLSREQHTNQHAHHTFSFPEPSLFQPHTHTHLEVLVDHVMQFSRHLHTSWAATTHHKRQQALAVLRGGLRQGQGKQAGRRAQIGRQAAG